MQLCVVASVLFCDSCRIQTCNLLIRSQMLYSVELTSLQNYEESDLKCDSCRIQTCNLLIRSQMLYSVELTSLIFRDSGAKVLQFSLMEKFFCCIFAFSPKKTQFSRYTALSIFLVAYVLLLSWVVHKGNLLFLMTTLIMLLLQVLFLSFCLLCVVNQRKVLPAKWR